MSRMGRIEKMEQLATEKGYKIVNSESPAFHFIHATKGSIKIHIASVAHRDTKIADYEEFEKELDNPSDFNILD